MAAFLPRRRLLLILSLWLVAGAIASIALVAGRPGDGPSAATSTASGFVLHEQPRPVPGFAFTDAGGKALSLDGFKGRTVLLNLWATWCAPCRKEMPALDRLQAAMGGPDFQVVTVSIDRSGLEPVRTFFDEVGLMRLAIYLDPASASTRALGVAGIPTTVLIDPAGREIGQATGPLEWDSGAVIALIRQGIERNNPTTEE